MCKFKFINSDISCYAGLQVLQTASNSTLLITSPLKTSTKPQLPPPFLTHYCLLGVHSLPNVNLWLPMPALSKSEVHHMEKHCPRNTTERSGCDGTFLFNSRVRYEIFSWANRSLVARDQATEKAEYKGGRTTVYLPDIKGRFAIPKSPLNVWIFLPVEIKIWFALSAPTTALSRSVIINRRSYGD